MIIQASKTPEEIEMDSAWEEYTRLDTLYTSADREFEREAKRLAMLEDKRNALREAANNAYYLYRIARRQVYK